MRKKSANKGVPLRSLPTQVAAAWPVGEMPLVMFGVNGERTVVATALRQLNYRTWSQQTWQSLASGQSGLPRFIGIIPYDEYCPAADRKQPPLIYEIHECLIWHKDKNEPQLTTTGEPDSCALKLSPARLNELLQEANEYSPEGISKIKLAPTMSDESYLMQAEQVLASIRSGTYYQLNLLRWFRLSKPPTWQEMCERIATHGGPYSMLLRHGNTIVASFSPECFVQIVPSPSGPRITTRPIKGTAERHLNSSDLDAQSKAALATSQKDLAELHMIVDLMRNDLSKVCEPMTVTVPVTDEVHSFQHVHHLVASVTGALLPHISMDKLFSALCPGGSITGAPKIEVMKHIRALECRDRGFVMGNGFIMDADGSFDSSILIRTATSLDGGHRWEYAAGSGIVIKSKPQKELEEIAVKCRPLTQ